MEQTIFIVTDDADDHLLVSEVFEELNLKIKLHFFNCAEDVINHVKTNSENPFLIISDVSLPDMTSFELREKLIGSSASKYKSIPFIFWSTNASNEQIKKAYDLSAHGFFVKENTLDEMRKTFKIIIEYWVKSKTPV